MRIKILLMVLIITVCAALSSISCTPTCPDIGKSAPEFTLKSVDGSDISLSDFHGKKVILNFWATWCEPCKFEIPFFQKIYSEQTGNNIVVVAVDVKETASKVQDFANSKALTFPILLDTEAKVVQKYCLPGALPITLFIDAEGTIKARKIGAFRSQAEVESVLNSL